MIVWNTFHFAFFHVSDVVDHHILDRTFLLTHCHFRFPKGWDLLTFPNPAFFGHLTEAVRVHTKFDFHIISYRSTIGKFQIDDFSPLGLRKSIL